MTKKLFTFRNDNQIKVSDIITLEGKQYLKTHATLIREGVFNGQLLTFDVLAEVAEEWNGRPIIMPLHLKDTPTDTWEAEFLAAHNYGFLDNVKANAANKTITADLYIDYKKLLGSQYTSVLTAIIASKPINGSVGFFTNEYEIKHGNFGGVDYHAVINKIQLVDHYAVLPYDLGACSIDKGCGVGLSKEGGNMPDITSKIFTDDLIPPMAQAIVQAVQELKAVELSAEKKADNEGIAKLNGMVVQLSEDNTKLTNAINGELATIKELLTDNQNKLAVLMQAQAGQPPHQTNGGENTGLGLH